MTLVMAAAQKMMPNSRKPRSPAAERKACAAGLAAWLDVSMMTPLATTPRMARNST